MGRPYVFDQYPQRKSYQGDFLINGLKETIDIESKYVFPLIKSSMLKAPVVASFKRYVIVTQKKVREDTSHITNDAPKTWAYLTSHKEDFSKGKICFNHCFFGY